MTEKSLLEVKELTTAFKGKGAPPTLAVRDLSFSLHEGKTTALVGESGSGKSVTALSLLGLLPYPHAFHPSGSVLFKGHELLNTSQAYLQTLRGCEIGMIFQEPMTALNPLHTLEKQISEPLILHKGFKKSRCREEVCSLLELVGFPEGIDRLQAFPHQLSGGQRQRVMIAIALACRPKILIADEPTTALDVTLQASILQLLKRLQRELKMSILLISHDLNLVGKMADEVIIMRKGESVEQGPPSHLLTNPQHPYTKCLLEAEPSGSPYPFPSSSPPLLTAQHLCVTFGDQTSFLKWGKRRSLIKAVQEVDFTLHQGETIGIVGESGSGKSTLSYALLCLLKSQGHINLKGARLDLLSSRALRPFRSKLQVVFQDPFSSLNPRFTVGQIVQEGLHVHTALSASQRDEKVQKILQEVELDPETRHRYPHEFSGGQRQRIAIARALILDPDVLILDEPTSALDRSIQAGIIRLLKTLQITRGLSCLFISHDLKVVRSVSHIILVMKEGKIVERGPAEAIFNTPQHPYTKKLIEASLYSQVS